MTELTTPMCLAIGGIISVVVSATKRIAFVQQYPKVVATILAIIVTALTSYFGETQLAWVATLICVLTQVAAAIGTHEAVVKPVQKQVKQS